MMRLRKIRQRNWIVSLGVGVIVCAAGCSDDDDDMAVEDGATLPSIVEVAKEAGTFTTLVAALEQAGLDSTLADEGPYTVFAPTDEAFAALPAGVVAGLSQATLADILTYHVIGAEVDAAAAVAADTAESLQGESISLRAGPQGLRLNGVVTVTATDIMASNGIVHVIDAVLLPPSIAFPGDLVQAASAYPSLGTLVDAVAQADLVSALKADNNGQGFTLFAPLNEAFAALGTDLGTLDQATLEGILLYHVVGSSVDASTVVTLTEAETLEGSSVTIAADSTGVVLDGSVNVTYTDLRASNGIIHILDGVLTPPEG